MVIDGNSIVNRAFYAIRLLTTKDGTPTNAVYGFLTILQKLLNEEAPDAVCVCFDLPAPTFRHEQFEAYKAQRKGMPDELAVQMPILKAVLDAMNIPRYELSGWEADDLIGTIARRCEEAGWDAVIVTGDKDAFQLVTEKTHVRHVKTRMGQTESTDYTPAVFFETYGFEPLKMVDLKALMGDASDNIPGVKGVGEKTALDLVRRFGSLEALYTLLPTLDLTDSLKKKLADGKEAAELSYQLATICRDAPIDFHPEDNKRRPANNDALYALFQTLEFQKLTDKFVLTKPKEEQDAAPENDMSFRRADIVTAADGGGLITRLESARFVAVRCDLAAGLLAVCDADEKTVYLLSRDTTDGFDSVLRALFSENIKKVGHDIKDTQRALLGLGIDAGGWVFDTALGAYLLSPTDSTYQLARLAETYGGFALKTAEDENGQLTLYGGAEEERLAAEVAAVARLYPVLTQKLAENGMDRLFYDIELPLCHVLAEMEQTGFLIDKSALRDFGQMLSVKIQALEKEIYDLAGEPFNINSPKQLGTVLFDRLMLPAPKKTKTGYSTNIEVLEYLADKHPIIGHLMAYRELTKLKSTYADGLLKVISDDGRIHTNFQMTVTATGRLSSTEPNLQNIPVRKESGGALRKMFVAGPGNVLVDADYSQIELRILAHLSGDTVMQAAFQNGEDIHAVTASQVFLTRPEDVTPLMRSRAKAVNFGIVYGISAFSLAQDIGVTVPEARLYIDSYFAKYSGVRAYMHDIVEQAKRDGFVTTLFGRRRYLPELRSGNFNTRAFGERVARNTPMQGTAADIIKRAMVTTAARLKAEGLTAKLILQIHDELIAECPEREEEAVKRILTAEMENAAALAVPLTAEAHAGKSWYAAK
ncbi:DNA polymerase I [Oscillospiraceae bacterium WX1]